MRALCIDDEALALNQTVYICEKTDCFTEVIGFTKVAEALKCLEEQAFDVVFLDIDMPEMNGLALAVKIKNLHPNIKIIFVTGYSQYAVDAFKIHAEGYLCKPIDEESVRNEISYWAEYRAVIPQSGIFIQTFGNFEVQVNGETVAFERQKAKEILAYLVNKQGTSVTRAELASILWEEGLYTHSQQKQLDVFIRSLLATLKQYNIDKIIERKRGSLRIVPSTFSCDFYDFLEGKAQAINNYCGSYLAAYSWAELTGAYLNSLHTSW